MTALLLFPLCLSADSQLGFPVCFRLSWNALGDGGAQELASALPRMERLKILE